VSFAFEVEVVVGILLWSVRIGPKHIHLMTSHGSDKTLIVAFVWLGGHHEDAFRFSAKAKSEQGAANVACNHVRLLEEGHLTAEREIRRIEDFEACPGEHILHGIAVQT
jgi:hypothetical protein